MKEHPVEKDIVLFDGFCNFCSGSVNFIIRRDPASIYMFAASQSHQGEQLRKKYGIGELATHSIILIKDRRIYQKSDAVLRIAGKLSGLWPVFYGFLILPPCIRDKIYDIIARNRYRFHGKRDKCFVPDPDIRDSFIK